MSAFAAPNKDSALQTFLEREGYGGLPLQRRSGTHLYTRTLINGYQTALMIDTGCPFTVIDRATARRIGLKVLETKSYISGALGPAQRYGVSAIGRLAVGSYIFTNVPVRVLDESEMNSIGGAHLDGLLGAPEMARGGMIIDCARQMIYVNPRGRSPAVAQRLAEFLVGRGFLRIPMRVTAHNRLNVDARVNGRRVELAVDTGSATNLLSTPIAIAAGVKPSWMMSERGQGIGHAQLSIGNLMFKNAEIAVANVPERIGHGMLGAQYLAWNSAIVDLAGMNLYLSSQ